MTFPRITSIRLQAANNFLFLVRLSSLALPKRQILPRGGQQRGSATPSLPGTEERSLTSLHFATPQQQLSMASQEDCRQQREKAEQELALHKSRRGLSATQ